MAAANSITQAVLYARFSPRVDPALCESNDVQLSVCRIWCLRKQYTIKAEFRDDDQSGADEKRRGVWQAIDALEPGNVLVVRWFSRLARDVYLSAYIDKTVLNAGARIESADGEGSIFAGMSPDDQLKLDIIRAFDSYTRRVNSVRTSVGMKRNQRNGRRQSHPTKIPFGWMNDPNDPARMLPCPEEIKAMDDALELTERGFTLTEIAKKLNQAGLPCRGREWDLFSVRKLLQRARTERAEQPPVAR